MSDQTLNELFVRMVVYDGDTPIFDGLVDRRIAKPDELRIGSMVYYGATWRIVEGMDRNGDVTILQTRIMTASDMPNGA